MVEAGAAKFVVKLLRVRQIFAYVMAHTLDDFPPYAGYEGRLCWWCFVIRDPDKARCKVRKEHAVLAELERRCPVVFRSADKAVWDCPVEGGCSLKRPDMLLDFGSHALTIEVDEEQHSNMACWDEDARLNIIAADVQKPLAVLRLKVDEPVACFNYKRCSNGERVLWPRDVAFDRLTTRAAESLEHLSKHREGDALQLVVIDAS
jgi:hypothetical protein